VPRAGAFDGPLGVLLGVALIEALGGKRRAFAIEVVGFSEEEGVRFGVPFIGSRALIGDLDEALLARKDANGISVANAIRNYGLDPAQICEAQSRDRALGYLEFHIEQGPVLESLGLALGVVQAIVGQSRLEIRFEGHANHAGATPMHLRRDALAGAAEWISAVEHYANGIPDLVATVGRVDVTPGAGNVIPGAVALSLDVRHPDDATRGAALGALLEYAAQFASRRGLQFSSEVRLDQPAVAMDARLSDALVHAAARHGLPAHRMNSGAGHDAMILARQMPAAMLFLRSPGGISHHPDELVVVEDVAAALAVGMQFLHELESDHA
jgi:allantoate deiminase